MANIRSEAESKELHRKILTAATALFMQKGFERTTVLDISKLSGIPKSKILYEMNSKEEILGHLVTKFLDGVTQASNSAAAKLTDKSYVDIGNGYTYYDEDGYILTGRNTNVQISIYDSCDITFNNMSAGGVYIDDSSENVTVTLDGDNYLAGYGFTFFSTYLTINGDDDDTLNIKSNQDAFSAGGNPGTLTVNGGKINAVTETTSYSPTIACRSFILNGGTVTASNNYYYVIISPVELNGGTLNVINTSPDSAALTGEIKMNIFAEIEKCLNGTHSYEYEVTSPAKCGVNAIERGVCSVCGETNEREVEGTALEHSFLDYVSNDDASCTDDGTKTAECIHGCGTTDTVTDEGSMLDHTDEDKDGICEECNEQIGCSFCGEIHKNLLEEIICLFFEFFHLVSQAFRISI